MKPAIKAYWDRPRAKAMKLFNGLSFAEDRILLEQLRLVMSNFRSTLIAIVMPPLLYWALANPSNSTMLAWWSVAAVLSNLNLQFYGMRKLASPIRLNQARTMAFTLTVFNLLEGLIWGLLPLLVIGSVNWAGLVLVVAVFTGMLGGGLATQSPVPLLYIAFAMPQTLMIASKLWFLGDNSYQILSFATVIYFISLFGQAKNSARVTRSAIEVRFELADSHAKLRAIEHKQTLEQERQRLMQDMHDGLGSSLISALRVVEHNKMDASELADVLKGCIDDLKLAIDSMEPVDDNLLLLLATLRFRLGPRLENTGIKLIWQVEKIPALLWLDPKNALHILRILQEAFANIIKHTSATEVRLATMSEGDAVVVTVSDNGPGFDLDHALKSGGMGLSGQKSRAVALGGEVSWHSSLNGTCLSLRLPISRPV
jgi:signal transduction histidine kinase